MLGTSKHALLPLKVGSPDLLVRTVELLLHLLADLTGLLLPELSSRLFTLDVLVGRLLTAPRSTGSVAPGWLRFFAMSTLLARFLAQLLLPLRFGALSSPLSRVLADLLLCPISALSRGLYRALDLLLPRWPSHVCEELLPSRFAE
jgi:hypothetical protein